MEKSKGETNLIDHVQWGIIMYEVHMYYELKVFSEVTFSFLFLDIWMTCNCFRFMILKKIISTLITASERL